MSLMLMLPLSNKFLNLEVDWPDLLGSNVKLKLASRTTVVLLSLFFSTSDDVMLGLDNLLGS